MRFRCRCRLDVDQAEREINAIASTRPRCWIILGARSMVILQVPETQAHVKWGYGRLTRFVTIRRLVPGNGRLVQNPPYVLSGVVIMARTASPWPSTPGGVDT